LFWGGGSRHAEEFDPDFDNWILEKHRAGLIRMMRMDTKRVHQVFASKGHFFAFRIFRLGYSGSQ